MSAPLQRHGAPQQPPAAAEWCRLLTPNEVRLALSAGSAIRCDLVEIRGGDIVAHLSLPLADGSGSEGATNRASANGFWSCIDAAGTATKA